MGGAGMEVVGGMLLGQIRGGWWYVGRCRSTSLVRGSTLMTPDHTALQMNGSR